MGIEKLKQYLQNSQKRLLSEEEKNDQNSILGGNMVVDLNTWNPWQWLILLKQDWGGSDTENCRVFLFIIFSCDAINGLLRWTEHLKIVDHIYPVPSQTTRQTSANLFHFLFFMYCCLKTLILTPDAFFVDFCTFCIFYAAAWCWLSLPAPPNHCLYPSFCRTQYYIMRETSYWQKQYHAQYGFGEQSG